MRLILEVWRQADAASPGRFERYEVDGVTDEVSMLELLDMLNAQLVAEGREPVAFDHDCREGICGTCGLMVNGQPHGPEDFTPACLQRVRTFSDGDVVTWSRGGQVPSRSCGTWSSIARRWTGSSHPVATSRPRPTPRPRR
jgi:succinate dehydrogenase/fumarate reductase-like Fe-S protein